MPKVKIEVNQPIEAALKYSKGKHFDSQFPGRAGAMMYSLLSGDTLFLDEAICDEPDELFRNAHVAAGDIFTLTLRKKNGSTWYEVKKRGDAFEGMPTDIPPAEPPSKLESQLAASIAHEKAKRQAQQPVTPSKNQPTTAPVAAQGTKAQQPHLSTAAQVAASALIAAIDAHIIAAEYGRSKGISVTLDLDFNAEDVRAVANTLYIQACKDSNYLAASRPDGGAPAWRH